MSAEHLARPMLNVVIPDEVLLARVGQREPAALAELYERYHLQAFALAYRMLWSRESAEEVVQDVFLSVWLKSATFDACTGRVRPWLFSVVHHRAVDRMRRSKVRGLEVPLDDAWMAPSPADVLRDVCRLERREQIQLALWELPAEQRDVIQRAYVDGTPLVEVAANADLPLGTVKSRARLGLKKLRRLLSAEVIS